MKGNNFNALRSINPRNLIKPTTILITTLLILSSLALLSTSPVEAATVTATFGNTAVGSMSNCFTTDRDASRFQLTQTGTVQSITVYFSSSGFNAKTAIYTDSNGAPSTLKAQSNAQSVTSQGWKTFTVPQTTLSPGYYWLCVVASSSSARGVMSSSSTNSHAWKTNTYSSDYPSTFGTPAGYERAATSIYATYTYTTTTPTSTPTPTTTPAPSPSPPSTSTMLGMGRPSWPYDRNSKPLDIQNLVNVAASSGANTWREAVFLSGSVSTYQLNLKSYLDKAGMKLVIQTLASSAGAMSVTQEMNIINNVGTAQRDWINGYGNKIAQLHPYAAIVMNEPSNAGTHKTASSSAFANYRQFCINTINAWRAIQPDLVIIVHNDPFNDFFDSTSYGFAANPLPFSNILYGRHIYYAYDNAYPPSYLPDQRAYWNGNTASGKTLLASLIDKESAPMIAKGQKVIWDEWGANVKSPNAKVYVQDFINICRAKSIGCLYYSFVPPSYECTGILNEDYRTLNTVGQTWAATI